MKIGQNEGLKERVSCFKDKNYGIRKNFDSKKTVECDQIQKF